MKLVLARLWKRLPVALRRRITWLTQPTFTVGVCAIVLNERDEILLLRHRFRESAGWDLPGGFIERDEELEDAIRRELREETGYEVQVLSHASTRIGRPGHLDVCFLARVVDGRLKVEEGEIVAARFFSREELPADLPEAQRSVISRALGRAG